jgi:hypothetical protein
MNRDAAARPVADSDEVKRNLTAFLLKTLVNKCVNNLSHDAVKAIVKYVCSSST